MKDIPWHIAREKLRAERLIRNREELDAALAAEEVEMAQARGKAAKILRDPSSAPTSELLAMFIGLSVGGAMGMSQVVEGTQIDRDHAVGELAAELDRRIPPRGD